MKAQNLRLILFIFSIITFANHFALASNYPRTKISVRQASFSGEKGKSFAESTAGYSAGISVFVDGEYFAPFIGVYYGSLNAKQNFIDNGAFTSSAYVLQSGNMEAGFNLYPIARSARGINVYLSAAGVLGYQSLALSKSRTFTKLPYSDQNYSTGYRGGLGVEWIINNSSYTSTNKWALSAEVSLKKESTVLLNQNFLLDGLQISLGLSW